MPWKFKKQIKILFDTNCNTKLPYQPLPFLSGTKSQITFIYSAITSTLDRSEPNPHHLWYIIQLLRTFKLVLCKPPARLFGKQPKMYKYLKYRNYSLTFKSLTKELRSNTFENLPVSVNLIMCLYKTQLGKNHFASYNKHLLSLDQDNYALILEYSLNNWYWWLNNANML